MPAGDGTTTNYNLILPAVNGAASTWGSSLNTNFQTIDNQMKINANGVTAIQNQLSLSELNLYTVPATPTNAVILFLNSAVSGPTGLRWDLGAGAGAEPGGNAGSNFSLSAFSDTGAYLGPALTVNRATQIVTLAKNPVGALDAAPKQYVDAVAAPVGSIVMWPSATLPSGWTWCLGQALSRASAPALFSVIGISYGAGDGSTTFNLPNLGSRSPFAYDTTSPMGTKGGETQHVLTSGEMPVHTHADAGHGHGVNDPQHAHTIPGSMGYGAGAVSPPTVHNSGGGPMSTNPGPTNISIAAGAANIQNAGGGGAHNNMHPYFVIGFIIRWQ